MLKFDLHGYHIQITKWQYKYCKTLNICFLINFHKFAFIANLQFHFVLKHLMF